MDSYAFQIQGKTITFTAAGTPPSPVQTTGDGGNSPSCYIISNRGTVDAFVSCEALGATATANAAIPTGATPVRVHVIPANSQVSIKGPGNAFFTGITASSTAVIYVSPGEGM
jgi:hypothetical protein